MRLKTGRFWIRFFTQKSNRAGLSLPCAACGKQQASHLRRAAARQADRWLQPKALSAAGTVERDFAPGGVSNRTFDCTMAAKQIQTENKSMIKTYGLTHIALAVKSAKRSFEFYRKVCGMIKV